MPIRHDRPESRPQHGDILSGWSTSTPSPMRSPLCTQHASRLLSRSPCHRLTRIPAQTSIPWHSEPFAASGVGLPPPASAWPYPGPLGARSKRPAWSCSPPQAPTVVHTAHGERPAGSVDLGKAYGCHPSRGGLLFVLKQDAIARVHVPERVGRTVLRNGYICFDLYQGLTPVKEKTN